jgi:uncharacterized metal-binding protein YceD (DUF177 family)
MTADASPLPPPEFSRPLPLARLGVVSEPVEIAASAAECAALARRFGLPEIAELRGAFRLRRAEAGRVVAEGRITARFTQICVVTLDPFPTSLDEAFELHFVPEGEDNLDPDPERPDEMGYEGEMIDLGEALAQQLAVSLDPFPRHPALGPRGAHDRIEEAEDTIRPFAGLAALLKRQN